MKCTTKMSKKEKNEARLENKKKRPSYKTVIEVEADELEENGSASEVLLSSQGKNSPKKRCASDEESIVLIRPKQSPLNKKVKRMSMGDSSLNTVIIATPIKTSDNNESNLTPLKTATFNKLKGKSPAAAQLQATPMNKKLKGLFGTTPGATPGTPGSSAKKRVSFILARSSEHGK
jgi:hypothetical protein